MTSLHEVESFNPQMQVEALFVRHQPRSSLSAVACLQHAMTGTDICESMPHMRTERMLFREYFTAVIIVTLRQAGISIVDVVACSYK